MNIAIRAEHLSKEYRLGSINHGMLYKDMQSWLALKLGRPDPHASIGADHFADQIDRFWALKDLSFDIKEGDRVGIIGRNGAGKSTLLKILSRITAPTEGVAKIKGRVASLLEVGTGFHGELTGRENIFLNGAILGMKKSEISRKLDEIIAFSEIEQYIDTPVKRYSSGMYVRLAFAVAAHLDSEILIADEVLAVGDASFQKKALGKMGEISAKQGRTVLFVSHNMGAVKQLCSSGMLLGKGRVLTFGDNILEVVAEYLHGAESLGQTSTEWTNDGSGTTHEFSLDRFAVLERDGSSIKTPVLACREFLVDIEFSLKENCPNLVSYVVFYAEDDSIAFILSPHMQIPQYKPRLGKNHLHCVIPANLLIDRTYRVEFQASLHQTRGLITSGENAPQLYLRIDSRTNYSTYAENLLGAVAPIAHWIER